VTLYKYYNNSNKVIKIKKMVTFMINSADHRYMLFILTCILSLSFFSTPVRAEDQNISIAGSSTIRPIITAAANRFEKLHMISFNISGGGSGNGIKLVAMRETGIGAVSRALRDDEIKKWPDLKAITIGYDGIAIIVNKSTRVTELTNGQLRDIYLGKISDWQELGGKSGPIFCISREPGRAEFKLFLDYTKLEAKHTDSFIFHRKQGEHEYSGKKCHIIGSNKDTIISVSLRRDAIAYVSMGQAIIFEAKTHRILLPSLDGVKAVPENVKNGKFPLTRPLNLVTYNEPEGIIKKFIDFMMSAQGQSYVFAKNFIPVNR